MYFLLILDVDECQANVDNCDSNAQCNNFNGSFNCTCLQGYMGNGVQCSGRLITEACMFCVVSNSGARALAEHHC